MPTKKKRKNIISYFPGLDPALPAFDFATKENRLDKEDADLVDVIHTNSGMIWEVRFSTVRRSIKLKKKKF